MKTNSDQLVVVPHDGTLDGDGIFNIATDFCVPFVDNMNLKEVKDEVIKLKCVIEMIEGDNEDPEHFQSQVKGGWIVKVKYISILEEVFEDYWKIISGDSCDYLVNKLIKLYISKNAIGFIGEKLK